MWDADYLVPAGSAESADASNNFAKIEEPPGVMKPPWAS